MEDKVITVSTDFDIGSLFLKASKLDVLELLFLIMVPMESVCMRYVMYDGYS